MQTAPGIGLDLIEIARLERALERRPSLAARMFSDGEREYASRHGRPGRHLAARFAAKEAALKALGLGGLRLHEVEVEGGGDRPPRLVLHGEAAARAASEGISLAVSLTHSHELAAAVVVREPAA